MFDKKLITVFLLIVAFLLINSCNSLFMNNDNGDNIESAVLDKIDNANYYLAMGRLDKGKEYLIDVIIWYEDNYVELPDDFIAEIYLTLGYIYELSLDMYKALENYEKALVKYQSLSYLEETFQTTLFIARVHYYLLNYDETLDNLNQCINLYKSNLDKTNIYPVVDQISKIYFNTAGVDEAIKYLESVQNDEIFIYNEKETLNIKYLLSLFYQRKGDIEKSEEIKNSIENQIKDDLIDKTDLDYYIHNDVYKYINLGNYNLALGLMMMLPLNDNDYFEILRIKRIANQESVYNIPIVSDYFKEFPYLYAGLFLIESGYLESKMINLQSGIQKISKAIEFFAGKNDKYHLAEAYNARGKSYYINGMYEKATMDLIKSSELYNSLGLLFEESLSKKYIGFSLMNIENNNLENSLSYLKDSSIAFEKINNNQELAPIYEKISYIYGKLSKNDLKTIYINKAIKSYRKLGDDDKVKQLELENLD